LNRIGEHLPGNSSWRCRPRTRTPPPAGKQMPSHRLDNPESRAVAPPSLTSLNSPSPDHNGPGPTDPPVFFFQERPLCNELVPVASRRAESTVTWLPVGAVVNEPWIGSALIVHFTRRGAIVECGRPPGPARSNGADLPTRWPPHVRTIAAAPRKITLTMSALLARCSLTTAPTRSPLTVRLRPRREAPTNSS